MTNQSKIQKTIVLVGYGGHGRVIFDTLYMLGITATVIVDPSEKIQLPRKDIEHIQSDENFFSKFAPSSVNIYNGLGIIPGTNQNLRSRIFDKYAQKRYNFPALIHPTATVSTFAKCSQGIQVMAGAIIQTGAFIGKNTIINTGASVDHDCIIGDHVHIAPGAILCGNVIVGERSFIGAGAVLLPGVSIPTGNVIAAHSRT